jgi:hypothetical protein
MGAHKEQKVRSLHGVEPDLHIARQRINHLLTKTADPKPFNKNDEPTTMDAIAKATRQPFRTRGRSYVALAFCPVVPIAGWLEEIDATLARSP